MVKSKHLEGLVAELSDRTLKTIIFSWLCYCTFSFLALLLGVLYE